MTTPYQKGVRAEYLLANELREQGWTVIRSAGSKGPADLVAWKEPDIRLIQVKRCCSVPELKRAIREAIDKFEESGVWFGSWHTFEIFLRYRVGWIRVIRRTECWELWSAHSDLLGQTEWPILEQEV